MALRITTPGVQRTDSSLPILRELKFKGDYSRKIFTILNDGPNTESFNISVSQGGTGEAFSLSPREETTGDVQITLSSSQEISFTVDYDSTKGTALIATVSCDTDIYGVTGPTIPSNVIFGPSENLVFSVEPLQKSTSRAIGPLLNTDDKGIFTTNEISSKFSQDKTSFGVIRTNPKLTGNVKITIDSDENLWLNSIDADKELSDERFKKYRVSPDSSYVIDLKRFFDNGQTPGEIVFSLYEKDPNYFTTKRSFSQQYDNFYQYGAEQLKSRFYEEEFSFFAPLYLKENVPEFFVIFRTEGPLNGFTYQTPIEEWPKEIAKEILSKSQIIKTYDLSETTPIGRYLRRIINHPSRRKTDISVSYQENGYTTFNGISYSSGTFVESGELLFDYFNEENPIIDTEEFITLGFQRNKVVSSHLLNLEFLFNDEDAENYSINRYFGFYVNATDLASFNLNAEALSEYSLSINQTPLPRKGVDGNKISQKSFIQSNSTGIKLFVDNETISNSSINENLFKTVVSRLVDNSGTFDVVVDGKFDDRINEGEIVIFSNQSFSASAEVLDVQYLENETVVTMDSASFSSVLPFSNFLNFSWTIDFFSDEKIRDYKKELFNNRFIEGVPRLFYIRDNKNTLHTVSKTREVLYNIDSFTQNESVEISLLDKRVDISDFTGFDELLTQTEGKLLEKGRASLNVEILTYFNPNDFIEIRWEPSTTSSDYPLRWRVIANSSNIRPGEAWPSYEIGNDSEGEYYFSYFNPGDSSVFIEQFVKSIQTAFDRFPFKNFEVLAKGNFLYFRSTQEGRVSESAKLVYSVQGSPLRVMGVDVGLTGSINFIGGSNRNRTRVRVSKEAAQGMFIDEYLSTKGSFSPIRRYSIQNEHIIFSPYLDEPVYDEEGEKLVDFLGAEQYMVISLENEISEIQLTFDKRITTYQLFKPSIGILSIFPLKDFDTDYYESDYTKTYTPELVKYFSRDFEPVKVTGISGDVYTFDQVFTLDSYPVTLPFLKLHPEGLQSPQAFNDSAQFKFFSQGATATLVQSSSNNTLQNPQVDDTVMLMTPEKLIYFQDSGLSKFRGFLDITSITSSEDELDFLVKENLWDPTRFNSILNSEYDRLSENYLKTLVLKSRVVPYIMKWVSPFGKDVRDNPYRFNYNRAFGNMGFSPSEDFSTPNPIFFTQEWPYLESLPDNYPIQQFPEFSFSYFFEDLEKYDFSSLDKDWFSVFFTTGYPVENLSDGTNFTPVKIDPFEKYSFFNVESFTDKIFTFFRGYRIEISEKNLTTGELIKSKKYDNYKFSVVMRTLEENPFEYQDPVSYKTIVNEKWKFILVIITVRTGSYRFPEGNLSYLDLYTMIDSNYLAYYQLDTSSVYQLEGFFQVTPKDKKLSKPINLQTVSNDPSLTTTFNYYDSYPTSNSFIDDLRAQILPSLDGNFSNLVGIYTLFNFQLISTLSKPQSIFDSNTLQLENSIAHNKLSPVPFVSAISLPYSSITWNDYVFYHQAGGNSSLVDISERTTFFEISRVLKGVSDKAVMNYEIYKTDGSFSTQPDFIMETVSPEKLERIFDFVPVPDPDKPSEFYNVGDVGVILEQSKDLQTLYRYQGGFSPKFKDVLKFWLREDEEFTNITNSDFLLSNTHLGTELSDFSLLKNQFYNKVSDNEILSLSPESGYTPVYPLVDEIAIDRKTIFAWNSTWDQFYYRKYLSTSNFQETKGTEEMKEQKSFLGSKMMKVPNQFDLYEYKLIEVFSLEDLETSEEELAFFQTEDNVVLQVNVYNRLLREFLGTPQDVRARKAFIETSTNYPGTFDVQDLESKVEEYLIDNILDLYRVSEVDFYILETGNSEENVIETVSQAQVPPRDTIEFNTTNGDDTTLTEIQLVNRNYLLKRDTRLKRLGNLKFQITYPLDSRFYTSLSVGVQVKRI